jgi:drug/metabolite transporter (DMT)-like permease
MIAVSLLAEPIVSTLLAFVLFSESLTAVQAVGAGLILAGIYLAAKGEDKG